MKKFKSKNHEIIGKFLSTDKASYDKYFWPREMKLAGKLLKKYTYDFLSQLKEPFVTKLSSLAWFFTDDGEIFLSTQLFEYKRQNLVLTKQKPEISLSTDKIGEDTIIIKKPKTLKEFLNYGTKQRN